MRKSHFTKQQNIGIVAEQERGTATAKVCRNGYFRRSETKDAQKRKHAPAETAGDAMFDFPSDILEPGRRFRVLGVIDDCAGGCRELIAGPSLSGTRIARALDKLIRLYGQL